MIESELVKSHVGSDSFLVKIYQIIDGDGVVDWTDLKETSHLRDFIIDSWKGVFALENQ